MGKLPESKKPTKRNKSVPKSDKWYSRIGVEKHGELKKNVQIRKGLFSILDKFKLISGNVKFRLSIEETLSDIDMSGEMWDD